MIRMFLLGALSGLAWVLCICTFGFWLWGAA